MKYNVIKSFCGAVNGTQGGTIELKDKAVIKDLLKAGYISKPGSEPKETDEGENAETGGDGSESK